MKSSRRSIGTRARVLVVDHDNAFSARLRDVLAGQSDFQLCRHVRDPEAAPGAIAEVAPDVVVADCDSDGTNAFPILSPLLANDLNLRILAASCRCDPDEAQQLLMAGASGCILKTETDEEILNALATVLDGKIYVSRAVAMPLLKRLLRETADSARSGVESLTARELRVFELLGSGLSTSDVAARLGVSCKTVESHRENIKHRLGLDGSAALIQYACAWEQRSLRVRQSAEEAARPSSVSGPADPVT